MWKFELFLFTTADEIPGGIASFSRESICVTEEHHSQQQQQQQQPVDREWKRVFSSLHLFLEDTNDERERRRRR